MAKDTKVHQPLTVMAMVFWVTLWDRFAEYLIRRGEDDGKHINENPRK